MILVISGWRQSGKDEAYKAIEAYCIKWSVSVARVSFADKLKEMTAEKYQIPLNYMHDQNLKEKALPQYPVIPRDQMSVKICELNNSFYEVVDEVAYHTPRSLLVLEGNVARSVDPDFWVKRTLDTISRNEKAGILSIITDFRYPSEIEPMRKQFTLVTARVDRFDEPSTSDPSERALDNYKFDVIFSNKGTLEEYHKNVLIALREMVRINHGE